MGSIRSKNCSCNEAFCFVQTEIVVCIHFKCMKQKIAFQGFQLDKENIFLTLL